VEGCVLYSLVGRAVCSVQFCRWKGVFGIALKVGQYVPYSRVGGCVRYSPVGRTVCSVQCCSWKGVFCTTL